jgi:hypothetical protein
MRALELPTNDCLVKAARCIEAAMATEEVGPVRKACMGSSLWRRSSMASPCRRSCTAGASDPCPGRWMGNGALRGLPL